VQPLATSNDDGDEDFKKSTGVVPSSEALAGNKPAEGTWLKQGKSLSSSPTKDSIDTMRHTQSLRLRMSSSSQDSLDAFERVQSLKSQQASALMASLSKDSLDAFRHVQSMRSQQANTWMTVLSEDSLDAWRDAKSAQAAVWESGSESEEGDLESEQGEESPRAFGRPGEELLAPPVFCENSPIEASAPDMAIVPAAKVQTNGRRQAPRPPLMPAGHEQTLRFGRYDGRWNLANPTADTATWLLSLEICGDAVRLGDGDHDLIVRDARGKDYLCGGRLDPLGDSFARVGKSKRVQVYLRDTLERC